MVLLNYFFNIFSLTISFLRAYNLETAYTVAQLKADGLM
jgi:hypothetical protein